MKITNKEFKIIKKELVERIKDIMFIKGISKEKLEELKENDELELTLQLTLVAGDIRQILGRIRRGKKYVY